MIVGTGSHTYEAIHGWGELPGNIHYGFTHGVVCDSQHRILIHNQSPHAVVIFDAGGKFVKSWGREFEQGAHGMWLNREGNQEFLYLSDYVRHVVVKTTLDGEVVYTLGWPEQSGAYESEQQYKPTNVAVAPNGDVYVGDGYGLSWIHQYTARGEYLRSFGGKGSAPGQVDCPHGLWVDTRQQEPVLLVADRTNQRLQTFTLDGRHLGFVTDELRRPCHFDAWHDELVIPDLWGRVTIFDRNNHLIAHLGDNPEVWKAPGYPNLPHEQRPEGKFIAPHAACVDPEGDIYVVEWIRDGRVTRLHRV
ncbi:MAG: hypothetical protein NTY38_17780 [Acidobacteria bacterium]|nr:hypothetical protein [Acidobacteriota bacterium]